MVNAQIILYKHAVLKRVVACIYEIIHIFT